MRALDLVHFEGKWTAKERNLVAAAVENVEGAGRSYPEGPGDPWIMLRRDLDSETLYMASRLWENGVFVGRSASVLADEIRRRVLTN